MKLRIHLLYFCLIITVLVHSQGRDPKTLAANKRDSMLSAKLDAKGSYPLIKSSKFSGVMPVADVTEKPEAGMKYKLLFNFTKGSGDSMEVRKLNRGLAEIGRIINLHIAAGIPRDNMEIVIVTHGKALYALLTSEAFKKQFKADNPNAAIINELESAGAKFIACGQAMQFLDIDRSSLPR